jgi:hypothetical protein
MFSETVHDFLVQRPYFGSMLSFGLVIAYHVMAKWSGSVAFVNSFRPVCNNGRNCILCEWV